MTRKGIIVLSSVMVILGLLVGIGCTQSVITPTASPTTTAPTTTASPTTTGPTTTASPSPTQPQVIKWRGQNAYPMTPADNKRWPGYGSTLPITGGSGKFFAEWIEKASGGRLVIDVAAPAAIVPVADTMTAVEKGTLDFAGLAYGGFHTGIIPEADVETGLPFAWGNPEEAWDGFWHWGIADLLRTVYKEHNIYIIPWGMGDVYHFGTTFEATGPDTIKGKKIRALGIYGKYVQALGGSPSTIAWGELYMAAKLGTIDGYIGGPSGLEDAKLKEVFKTYVVEPNLNTIGASFYFNQKSLDALPADIKRMITEDARFVMQGWIAGYYMIEHTIVSRTAAQGYTKPIVWSAADTAKARAIGVALWDEVAAKSPRCKQLVDILKAQAKDIGKM